MSDRYRAGATPGAAGTGTWIVPAGRAWDAVRLPRRLGLRALGDVAGDLGAIVMEPGNRAMYFLVPPGSTAAWELPQTAALAQSTFLVLPREDKERPPGPYWLISPRRGRLHTRTDALHAAIEAALGRRPGRSEADRPVLERLNLDQIKGLCCALCGRRLYADRKLGTFCTGEGQLAEPTDLWACAPNCLTASQLQSPTGADGQTPETAD